MFRMKRFYLFFSLCCLMLGTGVLSLQAQNLLAGWDAGGATGGTPGAAGWQVSGTPNWTANYFRINVGAPVNNGTNPMLFIVNQDVKFGYTITPESGKIYQLTAKAWRRSGGSSSAKATFNFYFADNLLATNPVSKNAVTLTGNNVVNTALNLRLVAPEGFTSGYFLWDVHNDVGTWDAAGLWLLNLTELGNAISVTFNTNGGSAIATQYFLEGETNTVNSPTAPTRSGYAFDGWTKADLITPVTFPVDVTENTIYYAKWRAVSDVSYRNCSLADAQYTEGDALPTPVWPGYTFEGWYSDAAFTTEITTAPEGAVTLYAKWTAINGNLLSGWDAYGDVGAGSEPNNYGWTSDEDGIFSIATTATEYGKFYFRDYNSERLMVTSLNKTFSFPVALEGGKYYEYSAIFAYFDGITPASANVPFFIQDVDGNIIADNQVQSVVVHGSGYKTGNFTFYVPQNGTYSVSFTNPNTLGKRMVVKALNLTELGITVVGGEATVTGELTDGVIAALATPGILSVDLAAATAASAVQLAFDNPNTIVYNVPENVTLDNGIEVANGAFVGTPNLTDLQPFSTANDITGAISYERAFTGVANGATGGWEVFNVPFKVTSVKATINGFEYDFLPYAQWYAANDETVEGSGFFWIKKATSGSNAISTSVESLSAMEANEPYLIAFPKVFIEGHPQFNVNGETFTFSGDGVEATTTLPPVVAGGFFFNQSYRGGDVQNAYLLNAEGDAFVKDANATVDPFRPFVTFGTGGSLGAAPSQFLINGNNDVTNIEEVQARLAAAKMVITVAENGVTIYAENASTVLVYDLNGALVKSVAINNGENFVSLPAGAYIINNKTVIVK